MLVKLNTAYSDFFIVNDDDGNRITGIAPASFQIFLYNPDDQEVSSSQCSGISEIGNGVYKVTFTPNKVGEWSILVIHTTYFPYGKGASYQCIEKLDDDLYNDLALVKAKTDRLQFDSSNNVLANINAAGVIESTLNRIKGLVQENYRIFDPVYTQINNENFLASCIIKIYNNKTDCDNDQNPIATYRMTSTYDADGRMISYKMTRES